MKAGRSLAELAAELDRQRETIDDFIADTRRMSVAVGEPTYEPGSDVPLPAPPVVLTLDGASDDGGLGIWPILPHAHGQIAERVKVPKRYYDRMLGEAPELLATNVNHWLQETPEKRLVRTLDGRCRAFLSDRYRRLDNYDLAETVLPILGEIPEARVESCELTDLRLYIKVVFPTIEREIRRVGDRVQSGVVISNSEVGAGALAIEPLVFKLSCLNGMIARDWGMRRYHVGKRVDEDEEALTRIFRDETLAADDKAFFMKVADLVRAAADEVRFDEIVSSLRDLADLDVPDPVGAVERVTKRFDLSEGESRNVLRHLSEGADLSAWGLVNAITRTAQDVPSYDRATDLEVAGGELVKLPRRDLEALVAA